MHPSRLPNGAPKPMVDRCTVQEGLKQVPEVCGVDTRNSNMHKEQLVAKLQIFDDFKYDLSTVVTFLIMENGTSTLLPSQGKVGNEIA